MAVESGQSPLPTMANPVDSLEARKEDILALLRDDNVKTVVLFGEMGVGKTWMAREVTAILKGSSYGALWIVLGKKYEERTFLENIAFQLSVFPSEEWEEDDKNAGMEQQERKVDMKSLKQRILDKLKSMKPAKLEEAEAAKSEGKKSGKPEQKAAAKDDQKDSRKEPYLLIVLDDIADEDQEKIVSALNGLLHEHLLKVLVTKRGSDIGAGSEGIGDTIQTAGGKIIPYKIEPLPNADSSNLLKNRVKVEVSRATGFRRLSDAIGSSSSGRPGVIIMFAEALNHVEDLKLDNAIEEAASVVESADITRLLLYLDDMLPSTLNKCCWHCRYLFRYLFPERSGIHYNELITHWLLEGYFDNHDHIEKAYEEAHCTLMELKDRGFLIEKDNSYVHMESDALEFPDHRRYGLNASSGLGLATVLKDKKWAGLERGVLTDGMIRTSRGEGMMSMLLVDGARLRREVPETFFGRIKQLRVLVILNPTFKHLPSSLSELKELQVLVLRGCTLLENVDDIRELTKLLALEISGAGLIKEIQDDLFKQMEELTSLNLSEVGIKSLPSSVLNRRKLRWLILRKCPKLEQLSGLRYLENLEVLDVSGSVSFKRIADKNLSALKKIQTLDLSQTKTDRLPFLLNLGDLTRLLLSDCPLLSRLPSLKPISHVEILDLSRATSLKEIQDDSLETKPNLRILDLSGSAVNKLPANISNPSHLLLSSCVDLDNIPSTLDLSHLEELDLSNSNIKSLPSFPDHSELRLLLLRNCKFLTKVPNVSVLEKLEALDLSGCSELVLGQDESFKHMSHLMTLNLSETKVESLPSDCFPSSLRRLLMRNCTNLKDLPSLEALSNLEELDLCGAKCLSKIDVEFLQHTSKLRILNLSEIKFEELPSVSHLTNLRELSLRGGSCKVSDLEALKELEVLDLSETQVESLQSLQTLSNLRRLLLRNCTNVEDLKFLVSLSKLEVLDLSGTNINDYPHEISDLSSLRKLDLQVRKHAEEIDWEKMRYVPYQFNLKCDGSASPEKSDSDSIVRPSISICGTQFLQFLEENSKLWDTCFQKFHFSVWLPKELPQEKDKRTFHSLGDYGLFRDIKSQGRIPRHKELSGFLEIHGPYVNSSLPEVVLKHADHISLIDNSSISHISELGEEFFESIKSFWLERCTEIRSIVDVEEEARVLGNLTSLYLCNLFSLQSVCGGNFQSETEVFSDLKSLCIEYCPMLANIFQPWKLPNNLETLEIKFCDEMKELFTHAPAECKLQTLDLMELPKLERIGVNMALLQVLKVRQCPNLTSLEETLGEAKNLEVLYISGATKLETICSQIMKPESFKNLKQLKVEFCPKLKELFKPHAPAERTLQTLDLMELPKLERIGVTMASLQVLKVRQCPNLKSLEETLGEAENIEVLVISGAAKLDTICSQKMKPESFKNLKQVKIESCPKLKEVSSSSNLPPNLEILEVKSCDSLETIFGGSSAAGSSLSILRVCNLPELKSTGFKVPRQSHVVNVNCRKLRIEWSS